MGNLEIEGTLSVNESKENGKVKTEKSDYQKPEIKHFGSVAELTQGIPSNRAR